MIFIKDTAGFECLMTRQHAWVFAVLAIIHAAERLDYQVKFTSDIDRTKGGWSYHPMGEAIDAKLCGYDGVDIEYIDAADDWEEWKKLVKLQLGKLFDVLIHDVGTGHHLHTEYDPKGRL